MAYRDYNYIPVGSKKKIKYYIDEWFDDRTIRVYESMRCIPPPSICPSNIYNTWVPFTVTNQTALEKDELGMCIIPEKDKHEIEERYLYILNHIKAMCGYDPTAYNYLLYWFGYLFAYPSDKSSMPNIIGSPGSGKSEMLNFIISIIGESRCLVTSKPQDDVWGTFNSLISNKYLILLEELSEKQTIEYDGIIKDLITGGRLTINTKGVKQYKMDSYLKMIALSNNITCKTISGDRRNVLINSSSEFIGNSEYFKKLREYQADKRIQMLFYERLLQLPNLSSFRSQPIPVTEYQRTIQNANREDYDLFIEDWISNNTGTEPIFKKSKQLYDEYVKWVKENDAAMKPSSHKKFIRNLLLHLDRFIKISIKTKECNMVILDIPNIMIKYGISLRVGCDDTEEDVDTEKLLI
jgi:hypothetical protein